MEITRIRITKNTKKQTRQMYDPQKPTQLHELYKYNYRYVFIVNTSKTLHFMHLKIV